MANKINLVSWAVNDEDVMFGQVFSVATLPQPVITGIIYVSDGAAGSPCLAFSDGTNWLRSDTLAEVSDVAAG